MFLGIGVSLFVLGWLLKKMMYNAARHDPVIRYQMTRDGSWTIGFARITMVVGIGCILYSVTKFTMLHFA